MLLPTCLLSLRRAAGTTIRHSFPLLEPSSRRLRQQLARTGCIVSLRVGSNERGARAFSTSAARGAAKAPAGIRSAMAAQVRRHMEQQRSRSLEMQEGMKGRENIPNDIGLIPQHFIPPTGPAAPSLFPPRQPLDRLAILANQVIVSTRNLASLFMYKFARGWRARAKRVITYRRVDLACKMHEEMYKAFAAADDAHLHRLTCAGLHSSLRARLAARPPRTAYTWRLLRHARRPRLVSVVAAPLPDAFAPPRSFLMQAVVLLRSRQALTRRAVRPEPGVGVAAAGRRRQPQQQQQQQQQQQGGKGPEEGEGERQQPFEHDAVEYLVLQKRMWGGKEEVVGEGLDGWRVWGFASETPLKDIRWTRAWREERRKERERLQKGMMEGSTGEEEAGSGQVVGHGKGA